MTGQKTVLVTGATGFIGRATCIALENVGWKVVKGVRNLEQSFSKQDQTVNVDLNDPQTVLALGKMNFDAIVHLGAHVGWPAVSEEVMFVPNVLSTAILAYLAKCQGIPLVFASAAIVHGVKQEFISDEMFVSPDTPYAQSKWLAEKMIESANPSHCILQIGGVFGYQGPVHLGLNRAIAGAIDGKRPMQTGSGRALRNYVYVKDVAASIVFVLEKGLQGKHLLAGNEILSIGEMLQALCDIFIPDSHPVMEDAPDTASQVISCSLALPPTRSFHDALRDIQQEALGETGITG